MTTEKKSLMLKITKNLLVKIKTNLFLALSYSILIIFVSLIKIESDLREDKYRLHSFIKQKFINKIVMPWGTGKKRYLITNDREPIHPSGRQFFSPVTYNGYTMESHCDRNRSIKLLDDLFKKLKLEFSLIEV